MTEVTTHPSPLFTAIDHVGVAVPDLEKAVAYYRDGPGLQQVAYRVEDIDAVCATLRERGARLLYDVPRRGTAKSRVNFIHPKSAGGVLVELVEPATAPD